MATHGDNTVYCGGVDGKIHRFDVKSDTIAEIGAHSHDDPMKLAVSSLKSVNESLLASAGWDGSFQLWDTRTNNNTASIELPGKAFDMDISSDGNMAVIATSGRRNVFVDLRSVSSSKDDIPLLANRESSLKYQTRCIKFFPDCTGIATGSIEGRVAIEYLDDVGIFSGNKKKYAFKCHRVNDTIYPVNTIAFHKYGTFATGGADGTVLTWDGNSKKKIGTVAKLPTSVACVTFSEDGDQIAMASSYTFEEGERDCPREEIFVRDILETEVRPKGTGK